VLSTAVLPLTAGFVLGDDVTGVVHLDLSDPIVSTLAEPAMFAIFSPTASGSAGATSPRHGAGRALGWGLLKLAALLVFGALISPEFLGEISWMGWVFAVLAPGRCPSGSRSGCGSKVRHWGHGRRQRPSRSAPTASHPWCTDCRCSTAEYPLPTRSSTWWHLTIALSILAHSSTDVFVTTQFDEEREIPG